MLELFMDTTYQTAHGQLMDLITAPIGKADLNKYTMDTYLRIVTFKTAYYTIYMPIACGMLLAGIQSGKALDVAKKICVKMGQYFQIQDDYLDCYGDPKVIGKVGTDIEESKCSWLVVTALAQATKAQKEVIKKNYGVNDKKKVASIKALYKEMKLAEQFHSYEDKMYKELVHDINKQKEVPAELFMWMLGKIFKRQK
jgi:farnesyl diphosphate synthase